jgi:DedD protein
LLKEPVKEPVKGPVAAKASPKEPPRPAFRSPKDAPAASPGGGASPVKAPADKAGGQGTDQANVRYVVQFGAFADAAAAHAARMKVERLGIKTYTQQIDTPAGKRIRVRMGPYADRAEAEKVLASMRKAGLDGAVLTL